METSALQEDLRLIGSTGHGLVIASTARDFGISDKVLRRLERNGLLMQLGSGIYAPVKSYDAATTWGRFDLRSRAWALSARNDGHAADFSAAAVLGLPMWGDPPVLPRLLRPGSAHRGHSRTPNGRIRYGWLPAPHQWRWSGVPVTSASYACIDVIRMSSRLQGLTIADYALAIGISRDQLWQIAEKLQHYKGMESVHWVLARADGRSESPLESAGRLACHVFDLPEVISNPWIHGGPSPRRVDLLLPEHGIILEGDGGLKYNDRPDAAKVVAQQVERERELRDLDFEVLRFDAALVLGRPAVLAARIRRTIARRSGRAVPTCWSLEAPPGFSGAGLGGGWPVPGFAHKI
ncbi:type IV toxin-antitoxin system AbiEi family antitoxin domain-containing protein [Nakamurella sp. PAMC28650]|uniref:type IV toxin-antitoxin system AbiEi family antitoxin domain-containing protein n=1 Tax=Nakamurella sp. PAMC28650 TaxID=2762325 RepID=UPI00164CE6EB|nr:type IV toxin-antitoxin system AbiEi family antitoxin domain-containing protein [Nakamurella sp. PAMC28650]QNK80802.1 type IV toxin-antitoxin system AbiEi family antitoxin domain-containing protein [Nakamurella sp. PAMC28650]